MLEVSEFVSIFASVNLPYKAQDGKYEYEKLSKNTKTFEDVTDAIEHIDAIKSKIYTIRGQRVMLDKDLASLYGVEVRVLNQAVKRNIKRFPGDFMFQLNREEWEILKSHFVTSSWGGARKVPYAFTEAIAHLQADGAASRKQRTVIKGFNL